MTHIYKLGFEQFDYGYRFGGVVPAVHLHGYLNSLSSTLKKRIARY